MSDSPEESDSQVLSGWTLISSQGEIVPGDGESESSESSIEVVSLDDSDNVDSHSSRRGWNIQQESDGAVVFEDSPSAPADSEQPGQNDGVVDDDVVNDVCGSSHPSHLSHPPVEELDPTQHNFDSSSSVEARVADLQQAAIEDEEQVSSVMNLEGPVLSEQDAITCEKGEVPVEMPVLEQASLEETHQLESEGTDEQTPVRPLSCSLGSENPPKQQEERDSDGLENLLGACCAEMLEQNVSGRTDVPQMNQADAEFEDENLSPVSVQDTDFAQATGTPRADASAGTRNDSDADSDFVCLDPGSPEEVENVLYAGQAAERVERVMVPLRISRTDSSIGPNFNFMRNEGALGRDRSDGEEEDGDEETESSTEDSIDDRIESEQSEAGSLPHYNDIGDLSSVSDIGDLPLVAGNVARNYRHMPNNHLTNVLNVIVLLTAILTMGISLGIIMATDLEIEEWQKAYEKEAEKVRDLKHTAETFERLYTNMKHDVEEKDAFNILKLHAFEEDKNFHDILEKLQEATAAYAACSRAKHLRPCYYTVSPRLNTLKLALINYPDKNQKQEERVEYIKPTAHMNEDDHQEQVDDENADEDFESDSSTLDGESDSVPPSEEIDVSALLQEEEDGVVASEDDTIGGINSDAVERYGLEAHTRKGEFLEKDSLWVRLDVKQLQQSLTREQERALHWQQLYLAERRQRERERENEEWEDERERERWEQEREQANQVECLQKLLSSNLTTLTQHILRWNVSVFDDFANLSMLMSSVAELKQSVVSSVNKVWEEAEEMIERVRGVESGREEGGKSWESSMPDQEVLMNYVNMLIRDVKDEIGKVLKDDEPLEHDTENLGENMKGDSKYVDNKFSKKSRKQEREDTRNDKWHGKIFKLIKRTRKSVGKVGRKLVGFLGKIQTAWEDRQKWLSKVKSYFVKKRQPSTPKGIMEFERLCSGLPVNGESREVDISSECMKWIRSVWQRQVRKNPCKVLGKFSRECNMDENQLKDEIKAVSKHLEKLMKETVAHSGMVLKKEINPVDMVGKFRGFLEQWGSSNLLLKSDITWAECQLGWWVGVDRVLPNIQHTLRDNWCHMVVLPRLSFVDSDDKSDVVYFDQQHGSYKRNDDNDNNDHRDDEEDDEGWSPGRYVEYGREELVLNLKTLENVGDEVEDYSIPHWDHNETEGDMGTVQTKSKDTWYLERAKYRLETRREKEKASDATSTMNLKLKRAAHDLSGEWVFEKAEARAFQRHQDHRSDWLFERAHGRRRGKEGPFYHSMQEEKKGKGVKHPNWFFEQANEREKQRLFEHRSDWVFERAEQREQYHRQQQHHGGDWLKTKFHKKASHRFRKHSAPKRHHNKKHNCGKGKLKVDFEDFKDERMPHCIEL
ncbi:uncharacterized protein LOC101851543 [Aplysia californica]|uniref:Uncharacterized protein LOC101851543 n=1 Tax=Aplysia californica TaxID=6500 RepID=A0ABM0JAR9_APLCA|nr:uncharacterized protein LOC101851543 [Aplysia californica]XP_005089390.1 uncharacterized protein LOC101851543 [Aplysia californica]XP_005089391.1 uncharacterized protein LOC101851543 [Aplysia californica]